MRLLPHRTRRSERFERTITRLDATIADGKLAQGAQLCLRLGGETLVHLAVGEDGAGQAMSVTTLCNVYCVIKPVTAIAVAIQVDAGKLDLDEPLGALLPSVPLLRNDALTLRCLLNHTAGLHEPSAVHMEMLTDELRTKFVAEMQPPAGWKVGEDAGFSEFVAWHLLGRVLEAVADEPLRDHLRRIVTRLGMEDTWIGMTEREYDANVSRIGMNVDLRSWVPFPMLLERSRRNCCATKPAYWGYTTAEDLARFYAALSTQLHGGKSSALPSAETLRTFCSTARARGYDAVLERECEYGLGFMTSLRDHHFGSYCSPNAFGQSGFSGTSFAFADPDYDLAVGVILNGITDNARAFANRSAVVEGLYRDLNLVG